ncbi:PfkB family carbohydrate kinase [Salipiger pacificus]|nr:PfkB family carbohydrate kinase [Alloyangia pacifica]MCA0945049.1 PfkB family carbohydrate kinase [Alloyangia pacifica]
MAQLRRHRRCAGQQGEHRCPAYARGAGAEICWRGETVSVPAVPCEVQDTTAAGDCFVGVFASALDRGLTLTAALQPQGQPVEPSRRPRY